MQPKHNAVRHVLRWITFVAHHCLVGVTNNVFYYAHACGYKRTMDFHASSELTCAILISATLEMYPQGCL